MSTTKTPKSKGRRVRDYGAADFKKLSPTELEKLGLSRKAERYKVPKNYHGPGTVDKNGTISKRKYTEAVFHLTNEQRAERIKSGARPILENAPKKARQGKIIKSAEARKEKQIKQGKRPGLLEPKSIRAFDKNTIRYEYFLGYQLDSIALDIIARLTKKHNKNSLVRIIMKAGDKARSTELHKLENAADDAAEWAEELANNYEFLKESEDLNPYQIQYFLQIYEKMK